MRTKTVQTTELQDRLAARLAATTIDASGRTYSGRWWGRGGQAERFYFGDSAKIFKNGKPIHGNKVWLEFDDAATLEGVTLHAVAKKTWQQRVLAKWHADAVIIAIELIDPEEAARLRAEIAAAVEAEEPIADMVAGQDD